MKRIELAHLVDCLVERAQANRRENPQYAIRGVPDQIFLTSCPGDVSKHNAVLLSEAEEVEAAINADGRCWAEIINREGWPKVSIVLKDVT